MIHPGTVLEMQSPQASDASAKNTQATTNGKERKRLKAETWLKLAINPEEIQRTPNDVMTQLIQQNSKLSTTVKERASDLYDD